VAPLVALAALLAGVLLLPYLLPYWYAYQHQGLARPVSDAGAFAATWRDYLSTPGRIHLSWWAEPFLTASSLFPGALGIVLTLVAIVRGSAFRDPRARMCLALGVAGVLLSFGSHVPGYTIAYQLFPPLRAIRAVVRFGYLGIVSVAALAGFGLVELQKIAPPRRWGAIAALLLTIAAIEPFRAPIGYTRFEGIPSIYRTLRSETAAVVVELPFYSGASAFVGAKYLLNSTEHWKPMLNGYSGFLPVSYQRNYEALERFPDPRSIAWLRRVGVTHVFVHVDELGTHVIDELDGHSDFQQLARDGDIVLYRFDASDGR
jgi:hypothetical protein